MRIKTYSTFFFLSFLIACSTPETRKMASVDSASLDYETLFQKTRETMISKEGSKNVIVPEFKKIPENELVRAFMKKSSLLMSSKQALVSALNQKSLVPSQGFTRLLPPPGQPGYSDLKIYVNHPYYDGDKLVPATDMIEVWREFILSAKKEIILNVFDFDLDAIAEALVYKVKSGVSVRVGVDEKNVVNVRPEVAALVNHLRESGVEVTGVNPVGLNHQKMTAIDWSQPESARVLFSSGNLTRSCLDLDGDLKGTVPLPKESVPNANHFLIMKSWVLSNLVHHELTKTLDPSYLLRGREYPLNGAYQVTGPGVDPGVMEAYPEPSLVITFSPGGGLRKIGMNIIADVIKREKGSIRMLQFAYSSADVDDALRFRAQKDFQETGKFDFLSVGDTPFALREWSGFLKMSGYKLEINGASKKYSQDKQGPWMTALTNEQIKDVRSHVHVAPRIYGNNWAMVAGKKVKVNAKIHHKVLATPNFAILGTSFNFSAGAESNNEQILVLRDSGLSKIVDGMVRYMVENSPGTVEEEALKRNDRSAQFDESDDSDVDGKIQ